MAPPSAVATSAGKAPAFWQPQARSAVLVSGPQTENAFAMVHRTIYAPNKQSSLYMVQDQGLYLLKGSCTVEIEDSPDTNKALKPGDFISIPSLATHAITVHDADTEWIQFYVPAGPEQFGMSVWPLATSSELPKEIPLPPVSLMKEIGRQSGIHFPEPSASSTSSTSSSRERHHGLLSLIPKPFIANSSVAPAFWVQPRIPELWTVLASALQTNNAYTLTEATFDRGYAATPLSYAEHDETYYILSGNASILINNEVVNGIPGDFVFIPRNTVFALNVTSSGFRALILHTPSGIIEGSLPMLGGVPAKERRLPKQGEFRPEPPPDDVEKTMARFQKKGIRLIKEPKEWA